MKAIKRTIPQDRINRWLFIAILLVLLLRLLLLIPVYDDPYRMFYGDSRHYDNLAQRLLAGTGYRDLTDEPSEILRPAGYPVFLAAIFGAFGRNYAHAAVFQLLLGALICYLVYSTVSMFAPQRAALIAALIYALDPASLLWATSLLSETLFAFFIVLTVFCLARWSKTDRSAWIMAAGLSAGLATLVRPIGQLLIPVYILIVIVRGIRFKPLKLERSVLLSSVLFFLLAALMIVPYSWRNKQVWGQFTVSSSGTYTLGRYYAASVLADLQGTTREETVHQLGEKDTANKPGDFSRYLAIILEHPWIALKNHFKGNLPTLFGTEYADWFRRFGVDLETPGVMVSIKEGDFSGALGALGEYMLDTPLVGVVIAVTLLWQWMIYAIAILGIYRNRRERELRWVIILLAITAGMLLFSPGVVGETRFRVPAQPLLIMLGGFAAASFPAMMRGRGEEDA
jgi:4-amino-4-deoxy-L-arabinose transferase-like glycosyltransferase